MKRIVCLLFTVSFLFILFCCEFSCSQQNSNQDNGEITIISPYWKRLETDITPSPRSKMAYAYDKHHQKLVVFGGVFNSPYTPDEFIYFDETWEFDGYQWELKNPVHRPSARSDAVLCYSDALQKIVLFGGRNGTPYFDDTWVYDGQDWEKIECETKPLPRVFASMYFDENIGKVLLFGGWYAASSYTGTCWLFDGKDWESWIDCGGQSPGQPQGRIFTKIVWDPKRERAVLFGGEFPFLTQYGDTWEMYDNFWHKVLTKASPHIRSSYGFTYYKLIEKCLFFGGLYIPEHGGIEYNDTWQYDDNGWENVEIGKSPLARHSMVYEYMDNISSIVMFGGVNFNMPYGNDYYLGDTWIYSVVEQQASDAPALNMPLAAVPLFFFSLLTYFGIRRRNN